MPDNGLEDKEEDASGPSEPPCEAGETSLHKELQVRLNLDPTTLDTTEDEPKETTARELSWSPRNHNLVWFLPPWIANNWDWSHWKPILRSALAAWISLFFVIIPPLERKMGQASFLVLITAFLDPPVSPFVATLEKELALVGFVTLAWAWSCFGIKVANLARSSYVPTASQTVILSGAYIEAAPTVIMAIFLYLGATFFLYIKGTVAPGAYLIASIMACITLDIALNVGAMFPYPYYQIGEIIVIPIAVHAAISLFVSILILPETVNAQYGKRLRLTLLPLADALDEQRKSLPLGVGDTLNVDEFRAHISKAEAVLPLLAASAQVVPRDISWGRFSAQDLVPIHELARKLPARLTGMLFYFELIDATREKFPVTPIPSRIQSVRGTPRDTPFGTPVHSRPPSPIEEEEQVPVSPISISSSHNVQQQRQQSTPVTPTSPSSPFARNLNHIFHRKRNSSTHHFHPHFHFPSHSFFHPHGEEPVGVFESQKYLNLETKFSHPNGDALMEQSVKLLAESSADLMDASADGVRAAAAWLRSVNKDRFEVIWSILPWAKDGGYDVKELFESKSRLEQTLDKFRTETRHRVLDPYRPAFDKVNLVVDEAPPHRYLYQTFVYQYHLMHFAQALLDGLNHIEDLERQRKGGRLWVPTAAFKSFTSWSKWEILDLHAGQTEDVDPDVVPGMDDAYRDDLGTAGRRDPDAFPPANAWEAFGHHIFALISGLGGGNMMFALKGGALTVILSLPSLIQSTAGFAYKNKFVWAIFMGQLTITRFRGDTVFGLLARTFSTFFGALIGLVMWYISSGNGTGNPYGLSAVCAACFPAFFFFLSYHPWPPMTKNILLVSVALVIGYSWQDDHLLTLSSPGVGWQVAWRRFVLVTCGVFAAFLFSFLPPSCTLRTYQRRGYATTMGELGTIYCAIVSQAHTHHPDELQATLKSLAAIRAKLQQSVVLGTNIVYEFSLRGRWPKERYNRIRELQFQISYLLAHLLSVLEQLDPSWTRAFLRRSRLNDPDFQGSVLSVISLISTALRLGTPLPQITPCPLLERFTHIHHGLFMVHPDNEEDYGLPRQLSLDVLADEQYLYFSMGISTVYGLFTRIDMLMMATKELVGEQYHLRGVGLAGIPLETLFEPKSQSRSVRSAVV